MTLTLLTLFAAYLAVGTALVAAETVVIPDPDPPRFAFLVADVLLWPLHVCEWFEVFFRL